MKIGIDIDGVIADSLHTWVRELNHYFAQDKEYHEINFYEFEKVYNVTWAEMDQFFRENQELLLTNLAPIQQASEIIKELKANHQIYLITARPEGYRFLTENWLAEHDIVYDRLIMTDYLDKCSYCQEHQISLFIEDSLANALAINQLGIPVLLFNAPYNQGNLPEGIIRSSNWLEIRTVIEKVLSTNS